MSVSRQKFLTHQDAALFNKNVILNFIKHNAPVSRTDIWERLNLSRASVTMIIKQFIEAGLVCETGTGESRGGRKPSFLEFNANAGYILVFDWHSKTLFITDLNSEVIYHRVLQLINTDSPEVFVSTLKNEIESVKKTQRFHEKRVLGLGLIMPGLLDASKGIVMLSTEQGWRDVNIKKMVENATNIMTWLEADGNMHAYGELLYGAGEGVKDLILFEIEEDGIGSALILNGELQRGSFNMIGEIGHIRLFENGPMCSCGKAGCLQAFIKDSIKRDSYHEMVKYIGIGLSILINILDPKVVILSGKVIEKEDQHFIEEIRCAAMKNVLDGSTREVCIEKSILGHQARVKGISDLIFSMNFKEI